MIEPDLSEDPFCPCPVFATCKTDRQLLNELWVWLTERSEWPRSVAAGDLTAFNCQTMRYALGLCKSLGLPRRCLSAQTWYEYCQGQDLGAVCFSSDVVRKVPGTGSRRCMYRFRRGTNTARDMI